MKGCAGITVNAAIPAAFTVAKILSAEGQSLPQYVLIKNAVGIGEVAAYKSMCYRSRESMTFKRAPGAFIMNILFGNIGLVLQIHYYAIGIISFSQKPSFLYLEADSGSMAHFLHHFFQGEVTFLYIFQHQQQAVLHQRNAGRGLQVRLLFFLPGVGGMIGGNNIQPVVQESLPECGFVVG